MFPLINNVSIVEFKVSFKGYENIDNIPFPITLNVYYQYYFIFFLMESTFAIFIIYTKTVYTIILISFLCVIISQCEILLVAFINVAKMISQFINSFFFLKTKCLILKNVFYSIKKNYNNICSNIIRFYKKCVYHVISFTIFITNYLYTDVLK